MASKASEVIVPKINRNAANAIAAALAHGIKEVGSTGNLLHSVCKLARAQYRGKEIPAADQGAILDTLCERMGWKGDRTKPGTTASARCSEYKVVLVTYSVLEETMNAFHRLKGKCAWSDGFALARLLRKGAKPAAAAKQHATRKPAAGSDPATMARSDAKGAIAKLVKRIVKMSKVEREFRDSLRTLCADFNIEL